MNFGLSGGHPCTSAQYAQDVFTQQFRERELVLEFVFGEYSTNKQLYHSTIVTKMPDHF